MPTTTPTRQKVPHTCSAHLHRTPKSSSNPCRHQLQHCPSSRAWPAPLFSGRDTRETGSQHTIPNTTQFLRHILQHRPDRKSPRTRESAETPRSRRISTQRHGFPVDRNHSTTTDLLCIDDIGPDTSLPKTHSQVSHNPGPCTPTHGLQCCPHSRQHPSISSQQLHRRKLTFLRTAALWAGLTTNSSMWPATKYPILAREFRNHGGLRKNGQTPQRYMTMSPTLFQSKRLSGPSTPSFANISRICSVYKSLKGNARPRAPGILDSHERQETGVQSFCTDK